MNPKADAEGLDVVARLLAGDSAGGARILDRDGFDFDAFDGWSEHHRLSGWLWTILEETDLTPLLPPPVRDHFRGFYLRQWTKNERLLREAASLSDDLRAEAPDHVFLKGPFLAHRAYGQIDRRAISDLDVLATTPEEIEAIDRLLCDRGYEKTSAAPLGRAAARRFAHHDTYRKGDLAVELHWALQRHFSFDVAPKDVSAAREELVIDGRAYWVASVDHELVLQILAAFFDAQVGVFRLKTLVDQHHLLALRGDAKWPHFFATRRREGLEKASTNVLAMALEILDAGPTFPVLLDVLASDAARRSTHGRAESLSFLQATKLGLAGKFRTFELYEASRARCILYWAISLPVRIAAHRENAAPALREN